MTINPKTISPEITIGEHLGQGGYGMVYRCRVKIGDDDKEYALKTIPSLGNGLPALGEAAVSMGLRHPYLNHAEFAYAHRSSLYLVMPLARYDMSHYRRIHTPTSKQLITWTFQLIQALVCLHKEHLIHGDIKASNVFLFEDMLVKLADFTLVTIYFPDIPMSHTVCTITHRPPEVLRCEKWNEKVDIWALGCTLYEIIHGRPLFPYQGSMPNESPEDSRRTLICINDWARRHGQVVEGESDTSGILRAHFKPSDDALLDDLILSMLRIRPEDRPSAHELMSNEIFNDLKVVSYHRIVCVPRLPPCEQILEIYNKLADEMLEGENFRVTDLGRKLFSHCSNLKHDKLIIASACILIALKLISRNHLPRKGLRPEIYKAEEAICEHLRYCLLLPFSERVMESVQ